MIHVRLHVRASREQVLAILRTLPKIATGGSHAADVLKVRMGLALLGLIKRAFVKKAAGHTDEAGDRWPKLKPETVAYNRRHPGVLWPGKKRAPYSPSWMLTKEQRARWWVLYRAFGGRAAQGAAYHQRGQRSFAAARAWRIIKSEGAKTLLGTYGGVRVQTLRDTDLLFNSLSPGIVIGAAKPPVPPPMPEWQVFEYPAGSLIIGTNRQHAARHHEGRGHNPTRRLWPEPIRWPDSWWSAVQEQGLYGLIDIARHLLSA
jgi:hypothetical protein